MQDNEVKRIANDIKDNSYVSCARRDFLIAKELNSDEGHIDSCNVVFHLEQCAEKLTKYIFIVLLQPFKDITGNQELEISNLVKKLRGISHNQAELLFELIKSIKIIFSDIGISNPFGFSHTFI